MRADASQPGDTGYYCIFHLPEGSGDEAKRIQTGRAVAQWLADWQLRPWFLHDFEVHVYYNIQPLVTKLRYQTEAPGPILKMPFMINMAMKKGPCRNWING